MGTHRERLTAPPSWWVVVVAFGCVWGWIMLVAANRPTAIGAAVLATAAAGALVWSYGSVVVEAGPAGLRVGTAHLSPGDIGAVEALDPSAFRDQLGPSADARAWLRTRPYIDAGVRIEVSDPSDPTPYWLVSSRRPEALVAALGQTKAQSGQAGVPDHGRHDESGEVEGGQEEEV